MKVLVTGATGFVGSEVCKHLAQAGHKLRLIVRHPDSKTAVNLARSTSSELVSGDVTDPASLRAALYGVDAVVHLVGIISEAGKASFENIHVRGTRNLVAAAVSAGVPRFVHMSALGTRPSARSKYHQTKWQAEESVRNSGLAYTIFRPSLIYGPRDHFVNLYASIARYSPVIPLLGRADALFQPVWIETVATAFASSLTCSAAVGQTYDLAGPERLTLAQIVNATLRVMGRKRLRVRIPGPVARMQPLVLKLLYAGILRKPPPLNRDQLIMLEEDNVGSPSKANDDLGLSHPVFSEAIRTYIGRA